MGDRGRWGKLDAYLKSSQNLWTASLVQQPVTNWVHKLDTCCDDWTRGQTDKLWSSTVGSVMDYDTSPRERVATARVPGDAAARRAREWRSAVPSSSSPRDKTQSLSSHARNLEGPQILAVGYLVKIRIVRCRVGREKLSTCQSRRLSCGGDLIVPDPPETPVHTVTTNITTTTNNNKNSNSNGNSNSNRKTIVIKIVIKW